MFCSLLDVAFSKMERVGSMEYNAREGGQHIPKIHIRNVGFDERQENYCAFSVKIYGKKYGRLYIQIWHIN